MNSKKLEIQGNYNSKSYNEIYDRRYKMIQFEKFESIWNSLIEKPFFLLDYGCGTGLLWDFFISKFQDNALNEKLRYIGIDISIGMLKIFQDKAQKVKDNRVHLICCDGEYLPFRSNLFQDIFAFTSLQNLPNLDQGLNEIIRIKKKKANIAISYLRKKIAKEILEHKLNEIFKASRIEFLKTRSSEDWVIKIN